jgi:hypothetical protein
MLWIVVFIIVSLVVGVVVKAVSNLAEANAAKNRPVARPVGGAAGGGGGNVRQTNSDMDRFLAEIDRLRKKSADAPSATPNKPAPVAPVVQPTKQPDRPRARVVAELADATRPDLGFTQFAPAATTGPKPGDLPIASVISLPSGTGAPATKVTRIANRPRPVAKTPFAKNLTGLLNSGNGLAMAIVLQEILGPPRSKASRTV